MNSYHTDDCGGADTCFPFHSQDGTDRGRTLPALSPGRDGGQGTLASHRVVILLLCCFYSVLIF